MKYANCHFHSTHSDGQYRPMHLARMAYGLGYRAVALTDHDVMSGNYEIMREAKEMGMEVLTGAEITCRIPEAGFHLVGLGMDIETPALKNFVDQLCEWRNVHTRKLFDRGVRLGLLKDITWDEVERLNPGCRWFCNEQVFRAMELKGVFDMHDKERLFNIVFRGAFAAEIGIHIQEAGAAEAISMIRKAGGIPILAHPHRQTKYIPELVELGLLGVEVSHSMLDAEDEKLAREACDAYGLYRSGGSDHEGVMGGEGLPLAVDCNWGVTEEDFHAMVNRTGK